MTRALIFDFDGVIADSEVLANGAMADALTRLGLPRTTPKPSSKQAPATSPQPPCHGPPECGPSR